MMAGKKESDVRYLKFNSINYISSEAEGRVVIASSHGGIYPAYKAAVYKARAVILNDAGVGFKDAGIACLGYCEEIGMAAAVVSNETARIGDVEDMIGRGIISFCNSIAQKAGCRPGLKCTEAAEILNNAKMMSGEAPVYEETRFIISEQEPRIICIDSASLVKPEDAGQIVVTGSHGGLIGGLREKAFNVDALAAVFSDAGVGIDKAGLGRLDPLDERGIAAVTVSNESSRIGDSRSVYLQGVISYFNKCAEKLGAKAGMPVKDFLEHIQREMKGVNL